MRLAEVHELVEAVGGSDPACRDRAVLSAVLASSARLRAWLDGRDVALAAQLEQVSSYPEKVLADASRTSAEGRRPHPEAGPDHPGAPRPG